MHLLGSTSPGLLRGSRPRLGAAALLGALLATGVPVRGPAGSPLQASEGPPLLERLSAALASGRFREEEFRGREVYSFDETRIGTLATASEAAIVALDPRLGLDRRCLAAPLGRLRLAAERRLLLDMTPQEFRTALAAQAACIP